MNRRHFLQKGLLLGSAPLWSGSVNPFNDTEASLRSSKTTMAMQSQGELLCNGIRLPSQWPPNTMDPGSYDPMPIPYLESPPQTIPIDTGRQLFVDDFLIEESSLIRRHHRARKIDTNPVFYPETPWELGEEGLPAACPKDGGIWWDSRDELYKMWYEAAWIGKMAYATSPDGLHWERPCLDIVPGTNLILPGIHPDSTTVFLDHDAEDPRERYKMFLRGPNWAGDYHGFCFVSPDGIEWSKPVATGPCGDRSTMFYQPFRKKWVYSIRSWNSIDHITRIGRARYYYETGKFLSGLPWGLQDAVFWTGADHLDLPDPEIGDRPQLYNLSAVGYESIMLGLHQIHLGPNNEICRQQGSPKITELMLSYSRDGFHWYRPDRKAFIQASRKENLWDRGYVQSVGGVCTIVGDQLRFYYTGFRGDPENTHPVGMKSGMYAHGSTGMAVLRRDGFVSMSAGPQIRSLTTRPLTFSGSFLFVNLRCPQGELRVEILDQDGSVLPSYSASRCDAMAADCTLQQVSWNDNSNLSSLAGKKVRFRFYLKNGDLYAFWVSPNRNGASNGYTAAGGPGLHGPTDRAGIEAYKSAETSKIF